MTKRRFALLFLLTGTIACMLGVIQTEAVIFGSQPGGFGGAGGNLTCSDCDSRFVNVVGDAMSGNLNITGSLNATGNLTADNFCNETGGCYDISELVGGGEELSCSDCDSRFVNDNGDTMTGDLQFVTNANITSSGDASFGIYNDGSCIVIGDLSYVSWC